MNQEEDESAADRLSEAIQALRDKLFPCSQAEHEAKRELERWFRRHGFTRSQARRATSLAYSVRREHT
jgi:hypothetical protein